MSHYYYVLLAIGFTFVFCQPWELQILLLYFFRLKIVARDIINDLIRKRINLHCIIFTKRYAKSRTYALKVKRLCDSSRPGRAGPLYEAAGVK